MRIAAETQARFSLLALLGILLACAAVGEAVAPRSQRSHPAHLADNLGSRNGSIGPTAAAELAIIIPLERSLHRPLRDADWNPIFLYLKHPSWKVAGTAYRVVQTHRHSNLAAIQIRLLERAMAENCQPVATEESFHQRLACLAMIRDVLDAMAPATAALCRELLVQIQQSGPSGRVRGRALELLAKGPPVGWQRMIVSALGDPSERVRLRALDIVAENRWESACPQIEPLAASPRPALRLRAMQVLDLFEAPVAQGEYGDSVFQSATRLADQLWQSGLEYQDLFFESNTGRGELDSELLHHRAEDYLDRNTGTRPDAGDCQGILFLAAAARAGERKLTLRLWEHEVGRTDSDAELLDRGLENLARGRMLAGLNKYRNGDTTGGLQELASVARLARDAGPLSSVQVYVIHASDLSAAIWQGTLSDASGSSVRRVSRPSDRIERLTKSLFDRLDLARPDHRAEALRRLDAWCGLSNPPRPGNPNLHPTAN